MQSICLVYLFACFKFNLKITFATSNYIPIQVIQLNWNSIQAPRTPQQPHSHTLQITHNTLVLHSKQHSHFLKKQF